MPQAQEAPGSLADFALPTDVASGG